MEYESTAPERMMTQIQDLRIHVAVEKGLTFFNYLLFFLCKLNLISYKTDQTSLNKLQFRATQTRLHNLLMDMFNAKTV